MSRQPASTIPIRMVAPVDLFPEATVAPGCSAVENRPSGGALTRGAADAACNRLQGAKVQNHQIEPHQIQVNQVLQGAHDQVLCFVGGRSWD